MPFEKAKARIAELLAEACKRAGIEAGAGQTLASLEEPRERGHGDLSSSICFELAKQARKAPREIAQRVASKVPGDALVAKVETAGAGYVNFFFNHAEFGSAVLGEALAEKERYGAGRKRREKVLIEYPSVNPNKPWHIGHARNAVLGDSLARIMEFCGYAVERVNYIDDLGLQVAQSVWGYENISKSAEGKFDHWLGRMYVDVAKRAEEGNVAAEVREILRRMEEGGNETAALARSVCERCVAAQLETAAQMRIAQDVLVWESDLVRAGIYAKALGEALRTGVAEKEQGGKNAGCVIARLSESSEFRDLESPDKVLVRSDGTATYTGKDFAFQMWKFGRISDKMGYKAFGGALWSSGGAEEKQFGNASVVINVIGVEQRYPQAVIRRMLELMGYAREAKNSVHLAYEHVWLPEAKFSGRKGTWIGSTADEALEEATERAHGLIKEKFAALPEAEKNAIAEAVGVAALRFGLVRVSPEKRITFDWQQALSLEASSAPYLQYAHARGCRIIEKAGAAAAADASLLTDDREIELLRVMAKFPSAVQKACREYRPHVVAEYLLDLAAAFNTFYNALPVLGAEAALRSARLALVDAARITLRNGLELLGITALERM